MELTLLFVLIATMVSSVICDGFEYPGRFIGGVAPIGGAIVGAGINTCGCPLGTRCAVAVGSPRCIPTSVGGVGIGFRDYDVFDHSLGGSTFHRSGQCYPFNPHCRATHYDRFNECRYTYSSRLRRCVKVYVTNACAFYNGRRRNLFHSRRSCQSACSYGGRSY